MTNNQEWEIAKFLNKRGNSKRSDMPAWVPKNTAGRYKYFRVYTPKIINGYPTLSPDDLFVMEDEDIDAYREERIRRINSFRDWLEPTGVVIANLIAIAALILSIISLSSGR